MTRASTKIAENFVSENNKQLNCLNNEVNHLKNELKTAIKEKNVYKILPFFFLLFNLKYLICFKKRNIIMKFKH